MISCYRGHVIEVKREKCMAGYTLVYYSVFRESDMYEVTSGCIDTADTVRSILRDMKDRVDAEIEEAAADAERERHQEAMDSGS